MLVRIGVYRGKLELLQGSEIPDLLVHLVEVRLLSRL